MKWLLALWFSLWATVLPAQTGSIPIFFLCPSASLAEEVAFLSDNLISRITDLPGDCVWLVQSALIENVEKSVVLPNGEIVFIARVSIPDREGYSAGWIDLVS